jgi:hypothetical protein
VKTLEHFHKYLYGQEFHLRTDHSALMWLLSFRNLGRQTARWVQRLQEYNFTSEHRQGIRHTNADALSKYPCPKDCAHCRKVERIDGQRVRVVAAAPADGWDQQALRNEQLADPDLSRLMREVKTGQRTEWKTISDQGPIYKSYWAQWKSLAVRNGVLVRHWESADGKRTAQLVIPRSRVKEVLTEMHGGTSGHLGVNKTIERARQRYYWLH